MLEILALWVGVGIITVVWVNRKRQTAIINRTVGAHIAQIMIDVEWTND